MAYIVVTDRGSGETCFIDAPVYMQYVPLSGALAHMCFLVYNYLPVDREVSNFYEQLIKIVYHLGMEHNGIEMFS